LSLSSKSFSLRTLIAASGRQLVFEQLIDERVPDSACAFRDPDRTRSPAVNYLAHLFFYNECGLESGQARREYSSKSAVKDLPCLSSALGPVST
jgi:hypothetical protein